MQTNDDDLFDADGVLRRNGTFTVPMQLCDSVQREVAGQPAGIGEAVRQTHELLQQSAWQGEQHAQPAAPSGNSRDEYIAALSNVWRTP